MTVEPLTPQPAPNPAPARRGRLPLVTTLLTLFGLAVAVYLTIAHYTTPSVLACADSGFVNCARVTTSPQSRFLGVPVAVLGVLFFVVLLPLVSAPAWRSSRRAVHVARLALVGGAMAFVLWLVTAELLILGSICIWCTCVHVTTFVLFILVVRYGQAPLRVSPMASFEDSEPSQG